MTVSVADVTPADYRSSGLSNVQPDLTLSASLLLNAASFSEVSSVSENLELDVSTSPRRKETSSSISINNATVMSTLGSILPEQITSNFLTSNKVRDLNPADIEKGS